MRYSPYFRVYLTIAVMALGWMTTGRAQSTSQVLIDYKTMMSNYNLISFGSASFNNYGDTEGALAIRGSLSLSGGTVVSERSTLGSMTTPSLYVGGAFSMNGDIHLNGGYASLPNASTGWSWEPNQRKLEGGGGKLFSANSPSAQAAYDPRTNPGLSWNWTSMQASASSMSATLAAATATGTIMVSGQNLLFVAPSGQTSGVVVFNFDMNLWSGNQYNGQTVSNVQISVPEGVNYVINVLNAAGKTIFGGSGVNVNAGSGTSSSRILWNIVNTSGSEVNVGIGGGNFYGSILAPNVSISNGGNTIVNGQVLATNVNYSNRELHYVGFAPASAIVPEASTYGLCALAACVAAACLRRRFVAGSAGR